MKNYGIKILFFFATLPLHIGASSFENCPAFLRAFARRIPNDLSETQSNQIVLQLLKTFRIQTLNILEIGESNLDGVLLQSARLEGETLAAQIQGIENNASQVMAIEISGARNIRSFWAEQAAGIADIRGQRLITPGSDQEEVFEDLQSKFRIMAEEIMNREEASDPSWIALADRLKMRTQTLNAILGSDSRLDQSDDRRQLERDRGFRKMGSLASLFVILRTPINYIKMGLNKNLGETDIAIDQIFIREPEATPRLLLIVRASLTKPKRF